MRGPDAGFALSIEAASDSSLRSRLGSLADSAARPASAAMTQRTKIVRERKKLRLNQLDQHGSMGRAAYFEQLGVLQLKLQRIQQAYLFTGDSAVIVFEGWDAAGKGGTIRRMSAVLDPRGFKVWPIAAPRAFEKERHYLFRFWERLPPQGAISVFDRSWYGRVLVERVEGMAVDHEWQRAYDEINEFERFLLDHGTRVVKLFLHITQDEQLRRFEERLRDPMKRWKLSYDDFRNRRNWAHYQQAVEDMVERTSTRAAPWHVIPANDKKYARIACIRIVTETLAANVDLSPPPLDERAIEEVKAVLGLDPQALAEPRPGGARPAARPHTCTAVVARALRAGAVRADPGLADAHFENWFLNVIEWAVHASARCSVNLSLTLMLQKPCRVRVGPVAATEAEPAHAGRRARTVQAGVRAMPPRALMWSSPALIGATGKPRGARLLSIRYGARLALGILGPRDRTPFFRLASARAMLRAGRLRVTSIGCASPGFRLNWASAVYRNRRFIYTRAPDNEAGVSYS